MLVAFWILVGSSFHCFGAPTENEQSPMANVARKQSFGGCKYCLVEDLRLYLDTVFESDQLSDVGRCLIIKSFVSK